MAAAIWSLARYPFYLGSGLVALAGSGLYWYQKYVLSIAQFRG